MYNLSEMEQNLKTMLANLQKTYFTLSTPQKNKQKNTNSILIKIPKPILLAYICPFLTMHEIRYIAHSCSQLKKRVYSPLGWKIINRIKTPYQVQVVFVKSDLKEKMRKVAREGSVFDGLDQIDDEKYIAKERAKFKSMLLSKYTSYLKSKEKYQACHEKVRTERAHLLRIKQQISYLEVVRQELDQQNKQNKEKLRELSEGFSGRIREMDQLNDNISKERTKLQSQKEALASKIRDYQHEIQMIKEDSEKSKQILRRLKNYLLYKEL